MTHTCQVHLDWTIEQFVNHYQTALKPIFQVGAREKIELVPMMTSHEGVDNTERSTAIEPSEYSVGEIFHYYQIFGFYVRVVPIESNME